jgi:hypothetical protein
MQFMDTHYYNFTGETSGWSNIQTISIPDGTVTISQITSTTPTISPTPTSSPTVPELSWLALLPILLSLPCVALAYKHRRGKHE